MSEQIKPPLSFWPMAVLGLLWNLMGCFNYLVQTGAESVAHFPEAYQAVILDRPAWATAAFGFAVFGGAVGCNLLLLRRRVAVETLLVSLMGTVVTLAHVVSVVGSVPEGREVIMPTVMSLVVAALLLWTAQNGRKKGWFR